MSQPTQPTIPTQRVNDYGNKQIRTGNLAGRRRMGYQSNNNSGLAADFIKQFDERMASPANDGAQYDLVVLNQGQSGLKLTALVVVATPDKKLMPSAPNVLAHHTLLLSATAPVDPIEVQHNVAWAKNRNTTRRLHSFDANDDQMKKVIAEALTRRFPGYTQLSAEASEVPRDISGEDKEALNDFIGVATSASGTVLMLDGIQAWPDFTLKDLQTENGEKAMLGVEISSSFAHVQGVNRYPVRGDIVLTVSESSGTKRDQDQVSGYNSSEGSNRISRIMGFIDLTWSGQQAMFGGMGMNGMMQPQAFYTPQFIITDVATDITQTLPSLFLALASVQALADNQNWKRYLIKQHQEGAAHPVGGGNGKPGVNMRDLGAVGYEVPHPGMNVDPMALLTGAVAQTRAPFPTQGISTDTTMLQMIVNNYINAPVLPISIDIAEAGTSTWVTSALLLAAYGNEQAIALVRGALDLLTDGEFSIRYAQCHGTNGGTAPIMINNNLLVNLGVWRDESYGDRDIRDLDYLSHLALTGASDPEAQANWLSLHTNANIDPWVRLEKVTEIQKSIFMNLRITGRAARVTFNPLALFVLAQCIAGKGFVFDIKDGAAESQGIQRVAAPWLANLANMSNLGASGAFQARHGVRPQGNAMSYMTNSGRGW